MKWPLILLIAYGAWLLILYMGQDRMIYPGAFADLAARDARPPAGARAVWIEPQPGVRVEAWFVPGEGRSTKNPGPAILITHGNYEVIDEGLWHSNYYAEMGVSSLLVEFRGFGRSGGKPTEAGITADVLAFYDWLAAQPEVDARHIAVHGRSVGGGPAAKLAAERPVAALILQSTFTSIDAMTIRYLAPPSLSRNHWRNDRLIGKLKCPILILHGRDDDIVPPSQAET
ncbi:MAG: alpha/beta hydrolase, partial [Planctomycetes bacterium]|nr:alpha/beta hydrolase [Planctomycetota bacterium]